jgi:membrane protein YdbS with pleckstrin-like domain
LGFANRQAIRDGGFSECRGTTQKARRVSMLTIALLLLLSAFVVTLLSALNKAPLWVAMILVVVVLLIQNLPVR